MSWRSLFKLQVNVDASIDLSRSVLVIKWDPDKWPKNLRSFTTQAHSKRGVLAIAKTQHHLFCRWWIFAQIGTSQGMKWTYLVVSINWGIQIGWFIMEKPIKMDDLGAPLCQETRICFCILSFGCCMLVSQNQMRSTVDSFQILMDQPYRLVICKTTSSSIWLRFTFNSARPVGEIFEEISPAPIASASLGQVRNSDVMVVPPEKEFATCVTMQSSSSMTKSRKVA